VFAKVDYQILSPDKVFYPAPEGSPVPLEPDGEDGHKAPCGEYQYPGDFNFKAGIRKLEQLALYDEGDSWGFEVKMAGLWDPAWHPEYGFQLTYLALAVGGAAPGAGALEVGMDANFRLPAGRAYDRIIYVGGGIEVREAGGKVLAAFVPPDTAHPLGFVADKAIRFRLPKALFPQLSGGAAISVLSGAQDDHGGAGLGNFRAVKIKAGQWHGGGATSDDGSACRLYDALYLKFRP
jgi:carbohydrate-binding DOMON domain-containing protein